MRNWLLGCWIALSCAWLVVWFVLPLPPNARSIGTNTLLFAGISSLAATICGYLMHLGLRGWAGSRLEPIAIGLRVGLAALVLLPLHLQVACWDALLGKLGWWQLIVAGEPAALGMAAGIWVQTMASIPWAILLLGFGLPKNRSAMEAQARLDGSAGQVFWRLTLRRHLPLLAGCGLYCFVYAAREIAVTDIYQIGTLTEEIYLRISGGDLLLGNWPQRPAGESATAWQSILFWSIFPLWLTFTMLLLMRSMRLLPVNTCLPEISSLPADVRATGGIGRWFALLVTLAMLIVPIVNLVLRGGLRLVPINAMASPASGTGTRTVVPEFQWNHLLDVIGQLPKAFGHEWQWSAAIGLSTSLVAATAALVAVLIGRRFSWVAGFSALVAATGMATPGPVLGLIVQKFLNLIDAPLTANLIDRSIFGPTLATVWVAFGPCWVLLWLCQSRISAQQIEASQVDGADILAAGRRILMPQMIQPVLGSFILAGILGYNELSASFVSMPAGIDTMPRRLLGQMHAGVNDQTAALSLVNLMATTIVGLAIWFLIRGLGSEPLGQQGRQ